jgi:hypothetical protein
MDKIAACSAFCLGLVSATALADTVVSPVDLNGNRVDICSGPAPGANDCSMAGQLIAASKFCEQSGKGVQATNFSTAGAQGMALHWNGGSFQNLPTGAVFSSVTCR